MFVTRVQTCALPISEQSDLADTFDYYYVPTFYVDGVKVHEGGIYAEEVEKILRSALE